MDNNDSFQKLFNDPEFYKQVMEQMAKELYKSSLRLLISSNSCEIEVNAEQRNQYMIIKENGEERNIYQDQDFTCDNFLFLDKGSYQVKFSPGVSENTFCRITKLEGYSGH